MATNSKVRLDAQTVGWQVFIHLLPRLLLLSIPGNSCSFLSSQTIDHYHHHFLCASPLASPLSDSERGGFYPLLLSFSPVGSGFGNGFGFGYGNGPVDYGHLHGVLG